MKIFAVEFAFALIAIVGILVSQRLAKTVSIFCVLLAVALTFMQRPTNTNTNLTSTNSTTTTTAYTPTTTTVTEQTGEPQ